MAYSIDMTYGAYGFEPVPFMTYSKQFSKGENEDSGHYGSLFNLTLRGTLVAATGGLPYLLEQKAELRDAFVQDGLDFTVQCNGSNIFECNPRIKSLNFSESNDNWVYTIPYTVELEFYEQPLGTGEDLFTPKNIVQANTNYSLEFLEETSPFALSLDDGTDSNGVQFRFTKSVTAIGKTAYNNGVVTKRGWEFARDYVAANLGYDLGLASGIININPSEFQPFNNVRTVSQNEIDGEYSVSESWILINSTGTGINGKALEDFTVTIRQGVDNPFTTVTIEGSIQGLDERDYGTSPGDFEITSNKYDNALDFWDTVRPRLYYRAKKIAENETSSLNVNPLTNVVAHNPAKGIINYTYEFDTRPANCIANAISEIIEVTDNNPVDVFARFVVLGRSAGPVLQDLNTVTEPSRTVHIELIVVPTGVCPSGSMTAFWATKPDTSEIIQFFEDDLTNNYAQVFKVEDTESWQIKGGRYSRTVGWVYGRCS